MFASPPLDRPSRPPTGCGLITSRAGGDHQLLPSEPQGRIHPALGITVFFRDSAGVGVCPIESRIPLERLVHWTCTEGVVLSAYSIVEQCSNR